MHSRQRIKPNLRELRRIRDHELELRRLSGEISCSNCRRLKVKCDKKIPCSTCIRRGAAALCPLGTDSSSSSQNSRAASSGSSVLYSQRVKRKLTLLSERIRALEDALAVESGARNGPGFHPLLTEGKLAIKQFVDEQDEEDVQEEGEGEEDQMLSAFGTLSVDENSKTMRYLGPPASESALLMEILENGVSRPSDPAPTGRVVAEVVNASKSFPFPPFIAQDERSLLAQLVTYLPRFERATALYEAFFGNLSWLFAPLDRSQFVSEIVPLCYPGRKPIVPNLVRVEIAHDLALLFAVFACGAVGDLTQSPINEEAERYNILAKAAMSAKSIMYGASLSGVQTLFLLSVYDIFAGRKSNHEDMWKFATLGSTMAADIGLHRDPSRWRLDAKVVDRRRRIFWEIYLIDIERSLESGRPSIFRPNVVDCEFPIDHFATVGENGETIEGVAHWRYRFLRDVYAEVSEKVCSSRQLKYREVLELDRKIRDFAIHPLATHLQPHQPGLDVDEFQRLYPLFSLWQREKALMYIHRNFFARAILDFPQNPMQSPFAASFLATYRSACTILRVIRENIEPMYLIVLRVWQIWSVCLNLGVIVGTVASLGSPISFSASAFVELEYVIAFFEKYDGHKVSRHGLPLLQRIREKALRALRRPCIEGAPPQNADKQATDVPSIRKPHENVDEELLILRGTTRLVEQRCPTSPGGRNASSHNSPSGTTRHPLEMSNVEPLGNASPWSSAAAHSSANLSQAQKDVFLGGAQNNAVLGNSANQILSVPYSAAPTWLSEPQPIYGTSSVPQLPQQVGQQQGQMSGWPNGQPTQSTANMNMPFAPFVPEAIPFQDELPGADTTYPNTFLDESISTEDWRTFMRQSGFSDTPPLDVNVGLTDPLAADTQDWQQAMPMFR